MQKTLTVLLVEDDETTVAAIRDACADRTDMRLVGTTNDSAHAVTLIHELLPDALILDLELHEGAGNGLFVLQSLRNHPPRRQPYVLVTTNNTSRLTYESARQLGADFILSKHQQDYRDTQAVEFLAMMREIILKETKDNAPGLPPAESPDSRRRRLVQRIHRELDLVGISPKAVGYEYITEGILLLVDTPSPNVPAVLASRHQKAAPAVERAMQNAIASAWRRTPIEDLYEHYTARVSSAKGVPTLSEFLYHYAGRLRDEEA